MIQVQYKIALAASKYKFTIEKTSLQYLNNTQCHKILNKLSTIYSLTSYRNIYQYNTDT